MSWHVAGPLRLLCATVGPDYQKRTHTVFALGVNLNQHLLGTHHLDDLSDVGTGLLQQAQLFAEKPHSGVVVIPLGLETAQHSLALEDLKLHRLDLVVIVVVERHGDGGCPRGSSDPG